MVTHWDEHWDGVDNSEAHYWKTMIHFPLSQLKEGIPTTFVKVEKQSRRAQKAWAGYVTGFRETVEEGKNSIAFMVHLSGPTVIPDKYKVFKPGWYLEPVGSVSRIGSPLEPSLFKTLRETSDWDEFESDCYKLLKLLGIHEIHPIKKQRGTEDGFFKIGNLVVVYDASLDYDIEKAKKEQIRNYCRKLAGDFLEYEEDGATNSISIQGCSKSAWVITRGTSRTITKVDSISVREIGVSDLMRIYEQRVEENFSEKKLADELEGLGTSRL